MIKGEIAMNNAKEKRDKGRGKKFLLFLVLTFNFSLVCFAENEFSLRLAPVLEIPLGLPQLGTGIGAAASLDWAFLPFAKKFDLGVSAGGSFASVSVIVGDPLILLEGKLGPFVRWKPYEAIPPDCSAELWERNFTCRRIFPSLPMAAIHGGFTAPAGPYPPLARRLEYGSIFLK